MIGNSAFLAAMTLLLVVFVVFGELQFLAPYKRLIFGQYLWTLVGALVLVFLNLFGLFYLAGRTLFLKDTGRKLARGEAVHRSQALLERVRSLRAEGALACVRGRPNG